MTGYCEDPSAVRPDRRARRRARARRDRKDKKTRAWGRILRIEVWKARKERGDLPEIDEADILAWADAHHARTGQWPTSKVGEIPEEPGETWMLVEAALFFGLRGLPGRTTLLRFLSEHWVRSPQQPSDFTVEPDPHLGRRVPRTDRPSADHDHGPHPRRGWDHLEDGGRRAPSRSDGSSRGSVAFPAVDRDAGCVPPLGKACTVRGADPGLGRRAPSAERLLANQRLGLDRRRPG